MVNLKRCGLLLVLAFLVGGRAHLLAQTTYSVVLTWTASTTAGAGYNLYRGTATVGAGGALTCPAVSAFTSLVSALAPGTVTYTDTAVAAGDAFCYYATATLDGVESTKSNIVTAAVRPAAPTGLAGQVKHSP